LEKKGNKKGQITWGVPTESERQYQAGTMKEKARSKGEQERGLRNANILRLGAELSRRMGGSEEKTHVNSAIITLPGRKREGETTQEPNDRAPTGALETPATPFLRPTLGKKARRKLEYKRPRTTRHEAVSARKENVCGGHRNGTGT